MAQLTLTGLSPTRNLRNAAVGANVALTFSAAVNTGTTGGIRVFGTQTGRRMVSVTGGGTSSITLNPAASFRPGELVYISVPGTVQRTNGNALSPAQVYQFTAAATGGYANFGAVADVPAGNTPRGVALADVDGDGDQDLLVANSTSNEVSVAKNNGNGTFATAVSVGGLTSTYDVVAGDVDGDGDIDFVATNWGYDDVSIRLNDGNGNFSGSATVAVGNDPRGVWLGDIDRDGDLDLVTANSGDGTVSIRTNNGSGTFSGTTNLALGLSIFDVVLADVDADGDLDLLATSSASGTVVVRTNNGTGTFGGTQNVAVGQLPLGLAVADVDGDGDLDLLTAAATSSGVSVRFNNGSGTFSGSAIYYLGGSPWGVAAADIDGDGDLDLLATLNDGSTVAYQLNNGSGVFSGGGSVDVGYAPTGLALADLDGDGDLDLAASGGGVEAIRLNAPQPTISGFSPTSGPAGTSVTITGTNFTGASNVSFNGTTATYTVGSATQITATVPAGASSGAISVTTLGGTATSSSSFTVLRPPTITSFTPTSGLIGTSITITGTNLSNATAARVNGVAGTITANTATSLTFTVAAGSTTGAVSVTAAAGTATSTTNFTVLRPPTISSFSPPSGTIGTSVTITGSNLSGATVVRVNGVAGTITVNTATSLTFMVVAGSTTGLVSVTTPSGTGTSATAFTVLNAAPVLATGSTVAYTENAAPVVVNSLITVADTDDPTLATATVSLTTNFVAAQDALSFTNVPATMGNIIGTYNASTGGLSLASAGATATLAQWRTALRAVRYANSSNAPSTAARTVSFTVNDGLANSNVVTSTITITPINDAPTATNLSAPETYTEDTPRNLTNIVVSDVDNTSLTVTLTLSVPAAGSLNTATSGGITSTYNVGTGVWRASGLIANLNTLLAGLTFTPAPNYNANFTIATSVSDGVAAATGTKPMTGVAVIDGPAVPTDANAAPNTVLENAATGTLVGLTATATDPDAGAILTYSLTNNAGGRFQINATTGVVTVANGSLLDYETATSHTVTVQVSDGALTNSQSFAVGVTNQPTAITSFTPTSGPIGTVVTVTGTDLSGATAAQVNGTAGTGLMGNTTTLLTFTVGAGSTTGPLRVTAAGGVATSATNFTIAAPTITSFTPPSGPVGTSVTLTGTNLVGATAIRVNGTAGVITSNTGSTIAFTVGAGSTSGLVSVTTPGGTASSTAAFTVLAGPTALSFSPALGPEGTTVTLSGAGFTGTSSVRFNGVAASFVLVSATRITATVPVGATTGPVSVTTPGGTGTSAASFAVLPIFAGAANQCVSVTPVVSTGSGEWLYLRAASGDLVAALNDQGTALGQVALEVYRHQGTVRADGRGREYLDRNWHLTTQNAFAGRSVRVRFYARNAEFAAYVAANDGDTNDATALSQLRLTQYSGANEDCQLSNNTGTAPSETRLLTPTTEALAGANWFGLEAVVADHFSEFYASGGTTPLPVELVTFRAQREGPVARLSWTTASEQHSAHFEVERSENGTRFERIGTVAAAGSSSVPRGYQLLDARLPGGAALLYYRLRQVDLDGTFSYSPVRVVTLGAALAEGLALFPNPARGGAATLLGAHAGTVVTVLDALGRPVATATADAAGTAALALPAGLPAGVYVVRAGQQALRLTVEQ